MGPFSHYAIANQFLPSLRPENLEEYFWGTVVPDIRYAAQMRREQTHLGLDRLDEFKSRYPTLKSFLLGYQVHVLIDQVDVPKIIRTAFPINFFQIALHKNFSAQQLIMMAEMYYLQTAVSDTPLAGDHNQVLADLGIDPEQAKVFQQALGEYFEKRSFDAAMSAFQTIGMLQNSRIEKYAKAYQTLQQNKIFSALFVLGIKNARLEQRLGKYVRTSLAGRA